MAELTSIAEHSDWLHNLHIRRDEKWDYHRKRVEFGKQTLGIWMFVPCKLIDGVWKVLEEPKWVSPDGVKWDDYVKEYQEAKDRVLFEGFEIRKGKAIHLIEFWREGEFLFTYNSSYEFFLIIGSTVENIIKYKLTLTPAAEKQIGL